MRTQTWCRVVFISVLLWALPLKADLIFSAPPRESQAKGIAVYQPVADFLTKLLKERVVYRYADNWLSYQSAMQKRELDIVFDGPHFVSWRIEKLQHIPLVKLPGGLSFVVVARKEAKFQTLKQLTGQGICAHAPPNLATLTILAEFDNPARQPILKETQGFPAAYKGVVEGRCVAGILQARFYETLQKEGFTHAIYRSITFPNQAISVSPRVPANARERIVKGFLSDEGLAATEKLRAEFQAKAFVPATTAEYQGFGPLLRSVWGFY